MKLQTQMLVGGIALTCSLIMTPLVREGHAGPGGSDLHRHAALGQTVKVFGHIMFGRSCTALDVSINVTQAPTHGTISTRKEDVKLSDVGFGSKCVGNNFTGTVVYYTRTSPGVDHFEYTDWSSVGAMNHVVTVD